MSQSARIADDVEYDALLERIAEFTLRAAFAHAADRHDWDQEELRRKGLRAVELYHNGRTVDSKMLECIDRDLVERWRLAGYSVPSLALDMRKLFAELEADAADCEREARESLVRDLLGVREGNHPNP